MTHHEGCYCNATNAPCSWCESLTEVEGGLIYRYGPELGAHAVSDHREEQPAEGPEIDPCPCRWCTGEVLKLECACSRCWLQVKAARQLWHLTGQSQETLDAAIEVAEGMRCDVGDNGRCRCPWCLVFGDDLHTAIVRRRQRIEQEKREKEADAERRRLNAERSLQRALTPRQPEPIVYQRRQQVLPAFRTAPLPPKLEPPKPAAPALASDRWELVELGAATETATEYEPDDRWKVIDIGGER